MCLASSLVGLTSYAGYARPAGYAGSLITQPYETWYRIGLQGSRPSGCCSTLASYYDILLKVVSSFSTIPSARSTSLAASSARLLTNPLTNTSPPKPTPSVHPCLHTKTPRKLTNLEVPRYSDQLPRVLSRLLRAPNKHVI